MFSSERQGTFSKPSTLVFTSLTLAQWREAFLRARRAEGRVDETIAFYRKRLDSFARFCAGRKVDCVERIDADLIRSYLLQLVADGHNPGGVHSHFRTIKTFLRWYEVEIDDPTFRNPIRKVKAPKVPQEIIDPVELSEVQRMVATCENNREGLRDKAILLTLLDAGPRAAELQNFDLCDLNRMTGELVIRKGKGRKGRIVFLGRLARRAVRAYLRLRGTAAGPLFLNRSNCRLAYPGLRSILTRRAKRAGLEKIPSPHDFRRAFALNCLRNGMDLLSLQRLLGHTDLSVLRLYVKQTADDLQLAHSAGSPVDRGGF
jgi:integrase/recombinase XerD